MDVAHMGFLGCLTSGGRTTAPMDPNTVKVGSGARHGLW